MPRYNKCKDPSGAVDIALWTAFANSTKQRATGLGAGNPRSTACYIDIPSSSYSGSLSSARADAGAGQTWSAACWLYTTVARRYAISFARFVNGSYSSNVGTYSFDLPSGVWTKVYLQGVYLGTSSVTEIGVLIDAPTNIGQTSRLYMTLVRIERVNDQLEPTDGASQGWSWDGTVGKSTSTLPDAKYVYPAAGEIVLDGRPNIAGGRAPVIRERLSAKGTGSNALTYSLTTSPDTLKDDILVAFRTTDVHDGANVAPSGTAGQWKKEAYVSAVTGGADLSIWSCVVQSDGAKTVTTSGAVPRTGGGGSDSTLHLFLVSRCGGVDVAGALADTDGGTTFAAPNLTGTKGNEILLMGASVKGPSAGAGITTAPTGLTKRTEQRSNDHAGATFDRPAPDAGPIAVGTTGYSANATSAVIGAVLLVPLTLIVATSPGEIVVQDTVASAVMVKLSVRADPDAGEISIEGPDPALYAVTYALPGQIVLDGVTPLIPIKIATVPGEIIGQGLAVKSIEHNTLADPEVYGDLYHFRYLTAPSIDEFDPYGDSTDYHDRYHVVPLRSFPRSRE